MQLPSPYDWYIKLNGGATPQFSNGTEYAEMSNALSANTWTHVAFTFSSGTVKGYINGSAVSFQANTFSSGNTLGSHTSCFAIGAYSDCSGSTSNFLPGEIDDVRIYNRVLSASEITSLYNARK